MLRHTRELLMSCSTIDMCNICMRTVYVCAVVWLLHTNSRSIDRLYYMCSATHLYLCSNLAIHLKAVCFITFTLAKVANNTPCVCMFSEFANGELSETMASVVVLLCWIMSLVAAVVFFKTNVWSFSQQLLSSIHMYVLASFVYCVKLCSVNTFCWIMSAMPYICTFQLLVMVCHIFWY